MNEFLISGGGGTMITILLLGILMLVAGIYAAVRRFTGNERTLLDDRLQLSVLALGGMAALAGVFFQTLGLYEAFQAIKEAEDVSPMIIIQGVFVSFYTTFFGLGTFLVSLVIWYLLKLTSGRAE